MDEIQLTEEETKHILARRQRNAESTAYNNGLRDAYNIVAQTIPFGVARDEVLSLIASLRKDLV